MEFNTVMEQKAHERKHDKIYSCQYCSTKFASLYFCQKHYDKHLADMKPYQCMSCGKRFQNSISLNIHHNRHKHLKCLFCDTLFVDELELLMHVRDHGIQSKHQFLAAVEYLDQEETQLEDMLCAYLKICTESRVTAGTSKGTVNTLGLDIPIPSISLLKIWWSQIKTLKLIQMFLCSGLICLIAAEYEPRKLTQHSLKYCQLDPANAGYTVANRTCRRGWLHK